MGSRKSYEAPDMGAFIGRTLRAMARRAAEGDEQALTQLAQLQGVLDTATADAARGLHDFGQSWAYIGGELGITRQAAQQRFGRDKTAPKATPVDPAQLTIDDQLPRARACWCGAVAEYLVPIDPCVTPWDGVTQLVDRQPAAPACADHLRDGYDRISA